VPVDVALLRPVLYRFACELGAVVAGNDLGPTQLQALATSWAAFFVFITCATHRNLGQLRFMLGLALYVWARSLRGRCRSLLAVIRTRGRVKPPAGQTSKRQARELTQEGLSRVLLGRNSNPYTGAPTKAGQSSLADALYRTVRLSFQEQPPPTRKTEARQVRSPL